jgi:hypothetical protein
LQNNLLLFNGEYRSGQFVEERKLSKLTNLGSDWVTVFVKWQAGKTGTCLSGG